MFLKHAREQEFCKFLSAAILPSCFRQFEERSESFCENALVCPGFGFEIFQSVEQASGEIFQSVEQASGEIFQV